MFVSPFVAFVVLVLLIAGYMGLIGALVILQLKERKHKREIANAKENAFKVQVQAQARKDRFARTDAEERLAGRR